MREETKKELAGNLEESLADRPPQKPVDRQVTAEVYKGGHYVRSHLYIAVSSLVEEDKMAEFQIAGNDLKLVSASAEVRQVHSSKESLAEGRQVTVLCSDKTKTLSIGFGQASILVQDKVKAQKLSQRVFIF